MGQCHQNNGHALIPLNVQNATPHTTVQGRLHEKNRWETPMGKNRLGPTDVDGKGSMTIVDGKNRWGQSMGQWVVVTKTMGMFYTPIGGGKSWATVTKTMGMLLYHQTCELQQLMSSAKKNVLC